MLVGSYLSGSPVTAEFRQKTQIERNQFDPIRPLYLILTAMHESFGIIPDTLTDSAREKGIFGTH